MYGNSCNVNALFNKGAHPCPSLFEESSVHLEISKPSGKPKKPKQPKRSRDKLAKQTSRIPKQTNNKKLRPMSAKVDMGLKVFLALLCVGFLDGC